MITGYLYLQTHRNYPNVVQVLTANHAPSTTNADEVIAVRYIARFFDLDAAKMHFHNQQRRNLLDVNAALYRMDLVDAIATAEAIELRHQQIWIDPTLDAVDLRRILGNVGKQRLRHRRIELIWRAVGALAIGWLILSALISISWSPVL